MLLYQLHSYPHQMNQLSLKFLNTATIKNLYSNRQSLFISKIQCIRFPIYFYLPQWFQQRLRTINSIQALSWSLSVSSFAGSYEAMRDKTLVKTITITFMFPHSTFSPSKHSMVYETVYTIEKFKIKVTVRFSNSPFFSFMLPSSLLLETSSFQTLPSVLALDLPISASSVKHLFQMHSNHSTTD